MKKVKIFLIMGGALCLATVILWRIAKSPTYQFVGDLLYHVDTEEKAVALLSAYDVPATFFMIGKNIEEYDI